MAQTTRRSYEITLRNTCSVALQQYCVGKWRDTQRNGTDHTFTQRHTSKLPLSFKTVVLMCRLLAATTLSKRRRGYEHKNSYISPIYHRCCVGLITFCCHGNFWVASGWCAEEQTNSAYSIFSSLKLLCVMAEERTSTRLAGVYHSRLC